MLSTNNLPQTGGQPKTFGPGNQKLKINSIELIKGYKEGSYNLNLHMEGQDLGDEFEGFYIDNVTKSGPKYKGQVGRVKASAFPFADGRTNSGIEINRDQSILRVLQNLAKVSGKEQELALVEADTIEEYVPMASDVLANGPFINFCIAGKEYENKGGYTTYDLFLPNSKGGKYAFTADGEDEAKLTAFDNKVHIIKQAPAAQVDGFEAKEEVKKSSFTL